MGKVMAAALMAAAAAWMPGLAQAQEPGRHHGWHGGDQDAPSDGSGAPVAPTFRAQPASRPNKEARSPGGEEGRNAAMQARRWDGGRPGRDPDVQAIRAPAAQTGQATRGDRASGWARRDGDRVTDRAGFGSDGDRRPGTSSTFRNGGSDWHGGGRTDGRRAHRDRDGDRFGNESYRNQVMRAGQDYRDGRRDRYRFDDRLSWSRDWRRDGRYDWNRYRLTNRYAFALPRYRAPFGWNYGYRRYSVGTRLSGLLFDQSYWIDDPFDYRLPDAYGPYRWVRYYGDALLVDIGSGQVVDVVYDIFD